MALGMPEDPQPQAASESLPRGFPETPSEGGSCPVFARGMATPSAWNRRLPKTKDKGEIAEGNLIFVTLELLNRLPLEDYFYNPLFVLAPIHNLG
jgi:hypothetical protein